MRPEADRHSASTPPQLSLEDRDRRRSGRLRPSRPPDRVRSVLPRKPPVLRGPGPRQQLCPGAWPSRSVGAKLVPQSGLPRPFQVLVTPAAEPRANLGAEVIARVDFRPPAGVLRSLMGALRTDLEWLRATALACCCRSRTIRSRSRLSGCASGPIRVGEVAALSASQVAIVGAVRPGPWDGPLPGIRWRLGEGRIHCYQRSPVGIDATAPKGPAVRGRTVACSAADRLRVSGGEHRPGGARPSRGGAGLSFLHGPRRGRSAFRSATG